MARNKTYVTLPPIPQSDDPDHAAMLDWLARWGCAFHADAIAEPTQEPRPRAVNCFLWARIRVTGPGAYPIEEEVGYQTWTSYKMGRVSAPDLSDIFYPWAIAESARTFEEYLLGRPGWHNAPDVEVFGLEGHAAYLRDQFEVLAQERMRAQRFCAQVQVRWPGSDADMWQELLLIARGIVSREHEAARRARAEGGTP